MNLMIYGIGGTYNNEAVGRAFDSTTARSLIRFLQQNGSYACSLHGVVSPDKAAVSGEFSIEAALILLDDQLGKPPEAYPAVYLVEALTRAYQIPASIARREIVMGRVAVDGAVVEDLSAVITPFAEISYAGKSVVVE
jgi:hypothetical protein